MEEAVAVALVAGAQGARRYLFGAAPRVDRQLGAGGKPGGLVPLRFLSRRQRLILVHFPKYTIFPARFCGAGRGDKTDMKKKWRIGIFEVENGPADWRDRLERVGAVQV